jgi:hypothetical protein
MGYVGNSPTSNFASVTKDAFSGDGSTTAFTLSKAATTNGVAVFVENVRQEPTTAYAVSGTTLTFTAAPVSASGNNIYVLHHNAPASTATHPAAQPLTATSGTFTGAFTSLGIDDNADATAITITSDEAVGIGKSLTPNNYSGYQSLTIGGSDATTGSTVDLEDSSGNLEGRINGTNGIVYIEADPSGATGASKISLEVDGSAKMTVLDGGDVNIADGNLVIGTNGHGIDFSAQTHATSTSGAYTPTVNSEVLDHYEEGTWAFGFNVNMTVETNSNIGRYTRIGNVVTVNARMDIKTISGSNSLFFNNLPFLVSAHTGSGTFENMYIGTLQTYNITNGSYDVMGKNILMENNSHTAYAMYSVHNGNHAYLNNSMASTSSELMMTLTYRTG